MRKVILYAAMSLDGYLADSQGNVDWIGGDGSSDVELPWYEEFYDTVDTILMGRKTYTQIVTELSPGIWLYGDKKTYVFTHQGEEDKNEIVFTGRSPKDLIHWLKHRKGKDIWLCGGKELISQLMNQNLIDEYHITLVPTLLGEGLSLFSSLPSQAPLKLKSTREENGMVDLVYEKREPQSQ